MTFNCFEHKMQSYCINMEIHIIVNLFDTTFEDKDLLRFVNM